MKPFKKIYIEITNRCNLSCSFCIESHRSPGFMTPSAFELLLNRVRGFTEHLTLHVLGEPLLHPDLGSLLDLCHREGFKVNLSTNGTLISQNSEMLLSKPALRQINFSLHSLEDIETRSAPEPYLMPIFKFVRAAMDRTSVLICLRLWNLDAASPTAHREQNEFLRKKMASVFHPSLQIPDNVTQGNGMTLSPRIFLSQELRFVWPHVSKTVPRDRGTCRGLRDHIAVLVDGTVIPCCLDAEGDIPLGNLFQQSLDVILSSPVAESLREGFANQRRVAPLCRRCNYRRK